MSGRTAGGLTSESKRNGGKSTRSLASGEQSGTVLRASHQQVKADRSANGGKLTSGEKAQVNHEQNGASKNIYNKKHNARTQPGTK